MNRLQLPHAKLFYIISEMYKKTLISDDEKRILKCKQLANAEKAISDDLQIFQVLDKYERTKSEEELEQNLINLVKGKGFNLILNEVSSTKHHDTASSQEPVQQQQAKPDEQHEAHPTNPIFTNPSIPDEISSPWAQFLRKKKQTQNKESALHDIKKNILEPHNAENDS